MAEIRRLQKPIPAKERNPLLFEDMETFAPDHVTRFDDPVWNLSPLLSAPTSVERTAVKLKHWQVPTPFRDELRRYAFARLFNMPPLAARKRARRPNAQTVAAEFNKLRRFADWLVLRGVTSPSKTTQKHLDLYLSQMMDRQLSPGTLSQFQSSVTKAYDYRDMTGSVWFDFKPWKGRHISRPTGRTENSTPRIPEPILGDLLKWALFYTEVAWPDIEAATLEWESFRNKRRVSRRPGDPESRKDRLRAYIDRLRQEGRGIPAHPARWHRDPSIRSNEFVPSWHAINRQSRISQMSPELMVEIVEPAIRELGLEPGTLETPISNHPDTGRPWRPRFTQHDVLSEILNLRTACFIVMAMSALRQSEIRNLRRGCVRTESALPQGPTRFRVVGEIRKFRVRPTPAKWIVTPEVVNAIRICEVMTTGDLLFSPWRCSKQADQKISVPASNTQLNRFANETIPHLAAFNGIDFKIGGSKWNFTGDQFRRTVAVYIANEPYGSVGGAIHCGHRTMQVFQGYAGSSGTGYVEEADAERQLSQINLFEEIYESFKAGAMIGGPAGGRLEEACRIIQQQLGDSPGVIVDESRKRVLLKSQSKNFHPGVLNSCLWDERKAMCKPPIGEDRSPQLNRCKPAECGNSCVTLKQLPVWKKALGDIENDLSRQGSSDTQIRVMKTERDNIAKVINDLESRDGSNR